MAKFSLSDTIKSLDNVISPDNNNDKGFIALTPPTGDGLGLLAFKVRSNRTASLKRNIIHWFVPDIGVVKMFVNPNSIAYNFSKNITKERTKGGFTIQYFGENLTTLNLRGTTGSSGIEGINVLYEIYRAEQLGFDSVGLSIAATNSSLQAAQQFAGGIGGLIGNTIGGIFGGSEAEAGGLLGSTIAQGIVGADLTNNNLAPKAIPTLSQVAFGLELYYMGWVFRGFIESMTVEESSEFLFNYTISFVVTQRRGYRLNHLPWQKSAIDGESGDNVPYTFANDLIDDTGNKIKL